MIARYLKSYTTALRGKPSTEHPFVKGYIDAFAGTGYRDARRDDRTAHASQALLLPDLAEAEPQALLDGSARLALKTEPRFDRYIFIERSLERCTELELLKQEFQDLAGDIQIRRGDANTEIEGLCAKDWSSHRAVLFLDPYGMQVDWTTIEAIARTKAIDLWVLFPLGIGVNRLLTKSGDIPESWRRRLNVLLGTEDWYEEFYPLESTPRCSAERWNAWSKLQQRLSEGTSTTGSNRSLPPSPTNRRFCGTRPIHRSTCCASRPVIPKARLSHCKSPLIC